MHTCPTKGCAHSYQAHDIGDQTGKLACCSVGCNCGLSPREVWTRRFVSDLQARKAQAEEEEALDAVELNAQFACLAGLIGDQE